MLKTCVTLVSSTREVNMHLHIEDVFVVLSVFVYYFCEARALEQQNVFTKFGTLGNCSFNYLTLSHA